MGVSRAYRTPLEGGLHETTTSAISVTGGSAEAMTVQAHAPKSGAVEGARSKT